MSSALSALTPEQLRAALPAYLTGFVADAGTAERSLANATAAVDAWSEQTTLQVLAALGSLGQELRMYPSVPACAELARGWIRTMVPSFRLEGVEHLRAAAKVGPVVLLCNHLAYVDANAIDALLAWSGERALADRLVVLAGPKVFEHPFRRVAATCIHTVPTPQSTSLAHTEKMSRKELVRRANRAMAAAGGALDQGLLLLIFGAGTRSRTGELQPFLTGVHRYFSVVEGVRVVPTAILGTGQMMPVGDERIHPTDLTVRFAPPIVVSEVGSTKTVLSTAHAAVDALLRGSNGVPGSAAVAGG